MSSNQRQRIQTEHKTGHESVSRAECGAIFDDAIVYTLSRWLTTLRGEGVKLNMMN